MAASSAEESLLPDILTASSYTILTAAVLCIIFYDLYCRGSDQLNGKKVQRNRLSSSASNFFDVVGDLDGSSLLELNTTYISDNLELKTDDHWLEDGSIFNDSQSETSNIPPSLRPVVVMFSWLMAQPRHVNKYVDIYTSRGYDVLVIKPKPIHLMWPANARLLAREVLDYLCTDTRPIVIHAFSVSAHVYAEMLQIMNEEPTIYKPIKDRVLGQVFDSCALSEDGLDGIYDAATANSFTSFFLKRLIETYFWFTRKYTLDTILKINQLLTKNPVKSPALVVFSKDDPIGTAKDNEALVAHWRDTLGKDVHVTCWKSSSHVAHLQKHHDEYVQAIQSFLSSVKNKNK
ncbi:transmembrane protein 53-A-like [Amphiura filiformis]|uniref:transmembrane protein 53-A-like n=1 Tax=Amphiura filiformis TaxID=82378 RepID=UPI003B221BAD